METNNATAKSDADQPERPFFRFNTLVFFFMATNMMSSSFLPVHRPAVAMLIRPHCSKTESRVLHH